MVSPLRSSRMFHWLAGLLLIGLLAACGSSPTTTRSMLIRPISSMTPGATITSRSGYPPIIPPSPGTPLSIPASAPAPGCPAAHTGRAAVLVPLTLGQEPTLLYTLRTGSSGEPPDSTILFRYTPATGAQKALLAFSHGSFFTDPQISADGQWLLFLTGASVGPQQLQLIRMDGQQRQTLYCGSISSVHWSPDQKLVSFLSADRGTGLYLLNLQSGRVQRELSFGSAFFPQYEAVTWLDSTHLYLHTPGVDAPASDILLLDIRKGENQKPSDLLPVFRTQDPGGDQYPFVDFDPSQDGQKLFLSVYSREKGSSNVQAGPSKIQVLGLAGGTIRTLYTSSTLAIPALRIMNSNSLCLLVENSVGETGQNGFWKMSTNGTMLTRLTTFEKGVTAHFNAFSRAPWANFSRDGSFYGLWLETDHATSLVVGSLQGGVPITIESDDVATPPDIVGWTTLV